MVRDIRYQAAVIRNRQVLLIQHREHATGRSYWLLPGGGREGTETPEQRLLREVREETHLTITIERMLLDDPAPSGDVYQRFHTYLCLPRTFTPIPGMEPEPEAAVFYAIAAVGWYALDDETTWDAQIVADPRTAPLLRRIRTAVA